MIKSGLIQKLGAIEKHMAVSNENPQEMKEMQMKITNLLQEAKENNDKMMVLQLEAKENNDKMMALQLEAKEKDGKMTLMQNKMLVQNFELHEFPIPRLFIILPVDKSKWDPTRILENKLRLHFLCECGDHTIESSKSSKNQIHLAKHEGYGIKDGVESFKKYGKYMLILMRALKSGMSSMPHIAVAKLVDAGIDYSISYIEVLSIDNPVLDSANTIDEYEGLERTDLRRLDKFLRINDQKRKLGNLYRIATESGHIKWVCIDHYRVTYKEKEQKAFTGIVEANGGEYDEELGGAVISLGFRIRAQEFCDFLAKARRVYDLYITFDWNCSTSDLQALEKALKVSNVSIFRLDLQKFEASFARKVLSTSTQNDKIVRIIENMKLRIVHILLSKEFIKVVNLQQVQQLHLHSLSIEIAARQIGNNDFRVLASSLGTNNILTTLDLRHCSIKDGETILLAQAVKINATLTTLDLSNNLIGNKGAIGLSKAIKINTTLTALNLGSNSIEKEGAIALSEALKTNNTLTTLDLCSNSIGNEGTLAFSEVLKVNSALTTLNLWDISIGKEGMLAFSEALKSRVTLITLNLWDNSMWNQGSPVLSEALKIDSILATLDLRYESIKNEGALALSEALFINTTLTTLYLKCSSIEKEGALALSKALKTNTTLTILDLMVNSIKKEGALALSEALFINTTLTTLYLGWNSIGVEGALALSEALKTNTTLTTLNLKGNSITDEGVLALSETLKANATLTTLR
ncbi:hypothetical protein BGZ46_000402 [Entomortierella lignicola]|nr:hypothetical protein BGZ46_000402 [Entomortierella lignicola]